MRQVTRKVVQSKKSIEKSNKNYFLHKVKQI